jgi:hypothetical protein
MSVSLCLILFSSGPLTNRTSLVRPRGCYSAPRECRSTRAMPRTQPLHQTSQPRTAGNSISSFISSPPPSSDIFTRYRLTPNQFASLTSAWYHLILFKQHKLLCLGEASRLKLIEINSAGKILSIKSNRIITRSLFTLYQGLNKPS